MHLSKSLGRLAIGRDGGDDLRARADDGVIVVGDGVVILTAELFKGLAGSLGDEEGGEAAEQHEESVDLKDVVHPRSSVRLGGAASAQGSNGTLADDGSDLAGGSGDTVGGGTVTGGEHLTGDNKGGGVGACVACSLAFAKNKNKDKKPKFTYQS
jgi:hypothetical protein